MTNESVSAEIKLHYEFELPEGGQNAPLLIAVHGYAAHMRYMMREAKLVAPDGFAIASIQGPNRFFRPIDDGQYKIAFGWLNDFEPQEQIALHHEFVNKVIERHAGDGTIDRDNVFLYGFSQACALNFRYAFTNPDALKGLIGVCGGIPGDLDENKVYRPSNAEVLYLYGDDDEFYSNEKLDSFDTRLREYLPNYGSVKYKAKHEITNEMRRDMKEWLTLKMGD